MLLKNKNTIITGANRGIGKAMVEVFAENGANIWACAREKTKEFEEFISTLSELNNVIIKPVYFDLNNFSEIISGAKSIISEKKSIDILVNNAGRMDSSLFQMTSVEREKKLFDVNYFSPVQFTQYIVKKMVRQNSGSIINVASSEANDCNVGLTSYCASKAAIISTTKVMAKELANYNIRVNAISPGFTMTDLMKDNTPDDMLKEKLQQTCMKRVGNPKEIANVVMFLASDLSSYITGQEIHVDGGIYR